MNFREETIEEFNLNTGTSLNRYMSFHDVVDNLETAGTNYFYISLCEDDVVEALEVEWDIAKQLDLDNVFIKELGIFVSLQP